MIYSSFFEAERMRYHIAKVNPGELWLSKVKLLLDDGKGSSIGNFNWSQKCTEMDNRFMKRRDYSFASQVKHPWGKIVK